MSTTIYTAAWNDVADAEVARTVATHPSHLRERQAYPAQETKNVLRQENANVSCLKNEERTRAGKRELKSVLVCFIFSNGSQFLSSKYSLLEDVLPHHKVVSSNATTHLQQRNEIHHCLWRPVGTEHMCKNIYSSRDRSRLQVSLFYRA